MGIAGDAEGPGHAARPSDGFRSFGPARRLVAAAWFGVAALVTAAALSDAAGAILAGLAAAALAAEALRSTLRPVALTVAPSGLVVGSGWRPVVLAWAEVGGVRAVRLGRLTPGAALEIEAAGQAYVLSAFRLGCTAAEAVAVIEGLRRAT